MALHQREGELLQMRLVKLKWEGELWVRVFTTGTHPGTSPTHLELNVVPYFGLELHYSLCIYS